MAVDAPIYPVGLVVKGRRCLVVGGGRVAARKIGGLLACGAVNIIVSDQADQVWPGDAGQHTLLL